MSIAWVLLGIAGILEIAFAYSMESSENFTRLIPGLLTVATGVLSVFLVSLSLQTLPVRAGYAVWAGIGAAGTAILGMAVFGGTVAPMRALCIVLILAGVVGLTREALNRGGGALQSGDVELVHFQHSPHDPLRFGRVSIAQQLRQDRRHDLPSDTVAVGEPAAAVGLAARPELLPIMVDLGLRLAIDHERDCRRENELRPAVERHEFLTPELERGGHDRTLRPGTGLAIAGDAQHF